MPSRFKRYLLLFLKLYLISVLVAPFLESLFAFSEDFRLYNAPQSLAMGDAWTADAYGYAANFYNPAGIATQKRRTTETNLVAFDGILGANAVGIAYAAQSFGIYRLRGAMASHPGSYAFFNGDVVPSFSIRNFSFALLGSYQYAGVDDGTNLTLNAHEDIVPTVGYARHFAGNLIQVGVSAHFIDRNEFAGTYANSDLASFNDQTLPSLFHEGWAIAADAGMMATLPNRYLPTLGIVWQNIGSTKFHVSHFLNKRAVGAPESLPNVYNAALSIHPNLNHDWKSTFALGYDHLEIQNLPWRKHVHFGMQFVNKNSLFLWAGANGFYPSAGVGLRVKGGNLEVGTYGEEIGDGGTYQQDRRFFFRYTIGF